MKNIASFFAQFSNFLPVVESLNDNHIDWMIGGSGCLYLHGNDRRPDDVDIYLADDQHDAADKIFGLKSYFYSSDQEHVRNSNPGGDHAIQLTSHLELKIAGRTYWFNFGEDSYLQQRQTAEFEGQTVYTLAVEDVLVIKALLQRGADVGKHDIADIHAFLAIHPDLDQDYLWRRIDSLNAQERVGDIFTGQALG